MKFYHKQLNEKLPAYFMDWFDTPTPFKNIAWEPGDSLQHPSYSINKLKNQLDITYLNFARQCLLLSQKKHRLIHWKALDHI